MIETQTHGDNHQAPHTRARILVTYFDGAMDAGASGRMAVEQMLRSLPATHVADFDAEDFINYRSVGANRSKIDSLILATFPCSHR